MADEPPRATLQVFTDCDNACVFCAQHGLAQVAPTRGALVERLRALREAHDEVTFTGGEPDLFAGLAELVREARSLGFKRVGLQTNGRRLRDTARALADAGLTDAHLSLHGSAPALHDHHTGVEGSLRESLAGASALRAAGVTLVATTVLTRSNFRSLGEMPAWLASRGIAAWRVLLPVAAGSAVDAFDRVLPRLALALPPTLYALEMARKQGLPAWIQGAPACLLGPFAARALRDLPRAYAPGCEGCTARATCAGVDARYLARFAGDELSASRAPKGDAKPVLSERERALARMFTDIGPRGESPVTAPARGRVALPLVARSREE